MDFLICFHIKKNNDKLYVLYNLGIQIHEELKKNKEENKLDGYTYKMFGISLFISSLNLSFITYFISLSWESCGNMAA